MSDTQTAQARIAAALAAGHPLWDDGRGVGAGRRYRRAPELYEPLGGGRVRITTLSLREHRRLGSYEASAEGVASTAAARWASGHLVALRPGELATLVPE